MDIDKVRAVASYHRAIAGLFWILEDELIGEDNVFFEAPFRLAIRQVLTAHNKL
jgi:hypothetical protein